MVEFEYSFKVHLVPRGEMRKGGWTLKATLASMHDFGYTCWWQSGKLLGGCIYPASGRCWRDGFECNGHADADKHLCITDGNLVCAQGHAGRVMHAYAEECARRDLE